MEVFSWQPRVDAMGQVSHRTLFAQFGDGYTQSVGDGININKQSWPLEFVGRGDYIRPIRAFLDRHGGYKAFEWTPPLGGVTTCRAPKGYSLKGHGADVWTLGVTFEEAPVP